MEIKLLSPVNNSVVKILPSMQSEILSTLPKTDEILKDDFDWRALVVGQNDYSVPAYINFCWGFSGYLGNIEEINLLIAKNKDFINAHKYSVAPGRAFMSITNFNRNTAYFWKMEALSGDDTVYETETYTFTTDADLPQWYSVDGVTNLRDIGGWPALDSKTVKEGMVLRGSELDFCEEEKGWEALFTKTLNIKTEIDFRFPDEIRHSFGKIPHAHYCQIPILCYEKIASDEQKLNFKKIFDLFADKENYPIYLHCVAGADRTGTVVALLKALLGVSENDIATDYELTSLSIYGTRSRQQHSYNAFICYLKSLDANIKTAAEKYLIDCGITEEQIEKIKNILLI